MTTDVRKPILVGEVNPYGTDPRYALYPLPERAAGDRLCSVIMGLQRRAYLCFFERVNLCTGVWSMPRAREAAREILERADPAVAGSLRLVLLGRKVATAFGVGHLDFFTTHAVGGVVVAILPHPSGLCRLWNRGDAVSRARKTLHEAGVLSVEAVDVTS